jgi:DNA-binding transcriptional regulator YdaS (Cro superfamily)
VNEIWRLLQDDIDRLGGQAAWARQHGFSPQYVNDILNGHKTISAAVARCLGYERKLVYLRREARIKSL